MKGITRIGECCYISTMTAQEDPSRSSAWRPLRMLLTDMDADIARVYAERGITGVRPRFSMTLIRLQRHGPMTIRELAKQVDVTHSAMSQTIAAMRHAGLVDSTTGADARTRTVAPPTDALLHGATRVSKPFGSVS